MSKLLLVEAKRPCEYLESPEMGICGEGEVRQGRPGGRVEELEASLELCLAQCARDLLAGAPQGLGTSQLTCSPFGPPRLPLHPRTCGQGCKGSLGSRKFPSPSEVNPPRPQDVYVMGWVAAW